MAIDDVVNNASPQGGLEKKVEEKKEKGFLRKAFDFVYLTGAAIGTTLLSSAFLGPLGYILGGAFGAGGVIGSMIKGTKSVYETVTDFLKTYASVNAVLAPMIWLGDVTYPLIGGLGAKIAGAMGAMVAKTAYAVTAYNAIFTAKFKAAHHMIENYLNPKGIVKSVKENYLETVKRFGVGFSPAYALTANGINAIMGIPTFAVNALPLAVYNGLNPIGGAKNAR